MCLIVQKHGDDDTAAVVKRPLKADLSNPSSSSYCLCGGDGGGWVEFCAAVGRVANKVVTAGSLRDVAYIGGDGVPSKDKEMFP